MIKVNINLFNKILIIALVLLIINTIIPLKVNAVSDMFKSADDFLSKGRSPTTVIDEKKLQSTSNTIYKWLMTLAICVAVIIGAIIGIQFITGSIEGKAKNTRSFSTIHNRLYSGVWSILYLENASKYRKQFRRRYSGCNKTRDKTQILG